MSEHHGVKPMKTIIASVTERGQVTIPSEVCHVLGLGKRGKVIFQIHGSEVRLTTAPFTLETAYGSVQPLHRSEDFDMLSRVVKEERATKHARSASTA